MNTHIVTRPFPHSTPLTVGSEVDASDWVNRLVLERTGYIKPIETEIVEAVEIQIESPAEIAPADTFAREVIEAPEVENLKEVPPVKAAVKPAAKKSAGAKPSKVKK